MSHIGYSNKWTEGWLSNLSSAYSPATGLFDRQYRNGKWDEVTGREIVTSTAIALIALHRSSLTSRVPQFDPSTSAGLLAARFEAIAYMGSIGLLIWALALAGRSDLVAQLLPRLENGRVSQSLTTMELAWVVLGLCHVDDKSAGAGSKLLKVFSEELVARQSKSTGLFYHCSMDAAWRDRIRRNVSNFADQIYPIQALSLASSGIGLSSLAQSALLCGKVLCALQGEKGQWWWHYDPKSGRVTSRYPVYSVHQYGMAPMALASLQESTGVSFSHPIDRSLSWIEDNEFQGSMFDSGNGTIWRDIHPKNRMTASFIRRTRAILRRSDTSFPEIQVNRETRPYEWAWGLYAEAALSGMARYQAAGYLSGGD